MWLTLKYWLNRTSTLFLPFTKLNIYTKSVTKDNPCQIFFYCYLRAKQHVPTMVGVRKQKRVLEWTFFCVYCYNFVVNFKIVVFRLLIRNFLYKRLVFQTLPAVFEKVLVFKALQAFFRQKDWFFKACKQLLRPFQQFHSRKFSFLTPASIYWN